MCDVFFNIMSWEKKSIDYIKINQNQYLRQKVLQSMFVDGLNFITDFMMGQNE